MEVRLLGPLELADGGRSIASGGARQRAVLALLVLQGNVIVQGRGQGTAGSWTGNTLLGEPPLQEGSALAIGLAFVPRRSPPGFERFSWSDQIRLAP
jgi:hypothetical protein